AFSASADAMPNTDEILQGIPESISRKLASIRRCSRSLAGQSLQSGQCLCRTEHFRNSFRTSITMREPQRVGGTAQRKTVPPCRPLNISVSAPCSSSLPKQKEPKHNSYCQNAHVREHGSSRRAP